MNFNGIPESVEEMVADLIKDCPYETKKDVGLRLFSEHDYETALYVFTALKSDRMLGDKERQFLHELMLLSRDACGVAEDSISYSRFLSNMQTRVRDIKENQRLKECDLICLKEKIMDAINHFYFCSKGVYQK